MSVSAVKKGLQKLADPKRAKALARFFKTEKGEYGEGDKFLGIKVPEQRKVAQKYRDLDLKAIEKLLHSQIHEHRLTALLILVNKYQKADPAQQKEIYNFYLKNTPSVNNWDLVDLSAPRIVGAYLLSNKNKRNTLFILAKSKNLWKRRIAILATFAFIKNKDFDDALKIATILLHDDQDLIHKAVGWMLREIGKIDQPAEEKFLKKHSPTMPRTMLRYAIEKFDERKRKNYLLTKQPTTS